MPAPSPRPTPLRVRSKGRDAFLGASFVVDSAVSRLEPVTPQRVRSTLEPPSSSRLASLRACWAAAAANRLLAPDDCQRSGVLTYLPRSKPLTSEANLVGKVEASKSVMKSTPLLASS